MTILISSQQNPIRLKRARIRRAAQRILSLLKHSKAELSILFVDNSTMQQLNNVYRGENRPTDVLSFEAVIPIARGEQHAPKELPAPVLGDIVINTERALSQAREGGIDIYDEVYRLMVHGTLHLLGYDHEKQREAAKMDNKEQEICNALKETC
ncbi:rRNA maturation RNase YbeY [bacterium]|nr:MAG: rRNA maturation RNase YbeY [bacterium]